MFASWAWGTYIFFAVFLFAGFVSQSCLFVPRFAAHGLSQQYVLTHTSRGLVLGLVLPARDEECHARGYGPCVQKPHRCGGCCHAGASTEGCGLARLPQQQCGSEGRQGEGLTTAPVPPGPKWVVIADSSGVISPRHHSRTSGPLYATFNVALIGVDSLTVAPPKSSHLRVKFGCPTAAIVDRRTYRML